MLLLLLWPRLALFGRVGIGENIIVVIVNIKEIIAFYRISELVCFSRFSEIKNMQIRAFQR